MIHIWTDGSCNNVTGLGGIGALIVTPKGSTVLSKPFSDTTSQRMELLAAVEALRVLDGLGPFNIRLTTDSKYLQQGMLSWVSQWMERQWRTSSGKRVSNIDLWEQLVELSRRHRVEWCWVKGHSGNPENELVDRLAGEARALLENRLHG